MPRRPNSLPTVIYWLLDIRPETIAAGWHSGEPFYCGKTVTTPKHRLQQHFHAAAKYPNRKISTRLNECGGEHFVKILTMEIVPLGVNWVQREKHWIGILRFSFPGAVNSTSGGQGAPGFIHSPETLARLGADRKGKKLSPEHRAKIVASLLRRGPQIAEMNRTRVISAATRAKISAINKGKVTPPETRAKMSAVQKGRVFTPEHRANMKASWATRRRALLDLC